jgi:glycosyltransferase involved in cell wall biosynthesis
VRDTFNSNETSKVAANLLEWSGELQGAYPPVLIPTFNNPTFLENTLEQLYSNGLENVCIIDNGSRFKPMIDLIEKVASWHRVITLIDNPGPHYTITRKEILASLPKFFIYTDPDLEFNPNLPSNFISTLKRLSEEHKVGKVGFALEIDNIQEMRDTKIKIAEKEFLIWEWEKQFWKHKVLQEYSNDVFYADIDTTFALYNQDFYHPEINSGALRVAGDFTAKHLPWYRSSLVPKSESNFYNRSQRYSYYGMTRNSKALDPLGFFEHVLRNFK